MTNPRLIIISNRLPVSVSKTTDGLVFTDSSGGLATAMSSLQYDGDKLWIGWPGIVNEDLTPSDKRTITRRLAKAGYAPVYLSRDEVEGFYEGYSNDTLWPLFHYFTSYARYSDENYKVYQAVNQRFLGVVRRHMAPDSIIWIHDYHLMLLPRLIRHINLSATIGFFLHIPFPSYEIFRALPERKAILRGLLGADLIGFHIYDYARHFLSSCSHLFDIPSLYGHINYGNRTIAVDAFPIGIDYEKYVNCLQTPEVKGAAQALREQYTSQKIIISVDRLDYSKGIPQRLEAFDAFLRTYPEWHRRVSMVMIAVPSRTEVEMYKSLRDLIEKTVSRINGTYGTIDWTPISYQFRGFEFTDIAALYSEADVALVTPLRDGMNLVAKEYVASKQYRPGVLILSEMAGAIDELPEALSVNPHDIPSIADAIHQALTMSPAEQRRRLASMQRRLARHTVGRWGADFLEQLNDVKLAQQSGSAKLLSAEQSTDLTKQFHKAKRRILFLDYDGTIRNFVPSRRLASARPSPKLLQLLTRLSKLPNTSVCIVSGRDKATLVSWFDKTNLWLVAEHGAYVKTDGDWVADKTPFADDKQRLLPLLYKYVDRTAGAILEIKDYSLVWHYRDVPVELAYSRTTDLRHDLQALVKDSGLSIYNGNKALEIKPTHITKGSVAIAILKAHPADCIMAIGDDLTDEDMFTQLPVDAVTINVGNTETAAKHQLPDVEAVLQFLNNI